MWYITPLHAKASNQCVNSLIAKNRMQTSHFGVHMLSIYACGPYGWLIIVFADSEAFSL
jgi:hypothetical protein